MTREQIRRKFSALLADTCESNPIKCNISIGEDFGISTLQLPLVVVGIFQVPVEGIICFNIDGFNEPIEFDDLSTIDLKDILKSLYNEL
jgi:hypothetical protein